MTGGPGRNTFAATGSNSLTINGGYLVVNAGGDGLDINGPITMTEGTVLINGPTNDGNGPIDYLGSFVISGGDFLAVGSAGMAMAPSTSSSQNSVMLTYSASQAAGTLVHIESDEGDDILTFAPAKTYQSVLFSSSALARGSNYVVYSGGRSTGTVQDGLYSGGTYTPGTEVTSFTISGSVTTVGSQNGRMPGTNPGTNPGTGTNPGMNPGTNPRGKPGTTGIPTITPTQTLSKTGTGTLSVTSTPRGASVSLDGAFVGFSPLTLTGVSDGSHELKLSRSGYQDYITAVTVTGGETTTVSASLTSNDRSSLQPTSSFRTNRPTSSLFPRIASASSVLIGEGSALLRECFQRFG